MSSEPASASGDGADTITERSDDAAAPVERSADRAAEPEDAPLLGATVDRYRVDARLGAGGMGVVYAAYDPALDRRVALKVLPATDPARRGELDARLRREAQALARLAHPNVVAVHDVGVTAGGLFVAMQLVDGPTLQRWLADAPRRPRDVLAVFVAAGRGLAAAHAAGIVHRDVKPSNVLLELDERGGPRRVYVGDFGLARGADDGEAGGGGAGAAGRFDDAITRAGAVMGTPRYMAPEQRRGEPADARSDQYSFCRSLAEALERAPAPQARADRLRQRAHGALATCT